MQRQFCPRIIACAGSLILGSMLLTGLAAGGSPPPQATGPLAPGTFRLTVTEREVSLDAYEAPLANILAEIGQRTGIPIVTLSPGVDERISIHLSLMPLDKVFKHLSPNVAISTAGGPNAPPHRIAKVYVLPKSQAKLTQVEERSTDEPFQFTFDPSQYVKQSH